MTKPRVIVSASCASCPGATSTPRPCKLSHRCARPELAHGTRARASLMSRARIGLHAATRLLSIAHANEALTPPRLGRAQADLHFPVHGAILTRSCRPSLSRPSTPSAATSEPPTVLHTVGSIYAREPMGCICYVVSIAASQAEEPFCILQNAHPPYSLGGGIIKS